MCPAKNKSIASGKAINIDLPNLKVFYPNRI
ncbi:MAG: hypothetical protein ACFCU7_18730 [Pleurocapsa sp.]